MASIFCLMLNSIGVSTTQLSEFAKEQIDEFCKK